jgi:hypothetical protein
MTDPITSRQDSSLLSTHVIAEQEGISPQAASAALRKALRKVGRALADRGYDESYLLEDFRPPAGWEPKDRF